MTVVNTEIKKVVRQLKKAQKQFQGFIKDKNWLDEARRYAETQGREVKKLLSGDMKKVSTFLKRERGELEKIQRKLPSELKRLRTFLDKHRKEFEKHLTALKGGVKTRVQKTRSPKRTSSRRSASTRNGSHASSSTPTNGSSTN